MYRQLKHIAVLVLPQLLVCISIVCCLWSRQHFWPVKKQWCGFSLPSSSTGTAWVQIMGAASRLTTAAAKGKNSSRVECSSTSYSSADSSLEFSHEGHSVSLEFPWQLCLSSLWVNPIQTLEEKLQTFSICHSNTVSVLIKALIQYEACPNDK